MFIQNYCQYVIKSSNFNIFFILLQQLIKLNNHSLSNQKCLEITRCYSFIARCISKLPWQTYFPFENNNLCTFFDPAPPWDWFAAFFVFFQKILKINSKTETFFVLWSLPKDYTNFCILYKLFVLYFFFFVIAVLG